MAFLLLLHQRMSLQRKYNKLTLSQVSIDQRKERIKSRIEKVQKAYAKKQSKLDAQAKMMTSYTNNQVQQQNWMMSQQMQNVQWQDCLGGLTEDYKKAYEAAYGANATEQGQKDFQKWMEDNKTDVTTAQQEAYQRNSQISWQKQMMQQQMNAYTTSVNDQVSIWLEVQKQALEDEEQMALAPLEEEDTQIDLEQASNDAQLTYVKSRLDAIKQALESSAQEAPKFGA